MRQAFRDPELQAAFERDGYAVVRLLSAEAAHGLCEALAALDRELGAPPVRPDEALRKSFFHPDPEYRRRADALGRAAMADTLEPRLADYRIVACGFFEKRPRAVEMGIHRDWTMVRDPSLPVVNAWCALAEAGAENGALAVLPGSHRLPNLETAGTPPFFAAYADALKKRSRLLPLAAGEAVLFDNRLLHWSAANRSAVARPALRAVALPAEEPLVFYRRAGDAGGGFELIELGEDGFAFNPADLEAGRVARPTLGYVEDRNRPLSLRECDRLLRGAAPAPRGLARLAALLGR